MAPSKQKSKQKSKAPRPPSPEEEMPVKWVQVTGVLSINCVTHTLEFDNVDTLRTIIRLIFTELSDKVKGIFGLESPLSFTGIDLYKCMSVTNHDLV
jgi:hypothetical protein